MFLRTFRILMAEADATPNPGAPAPTPAAAPPEPPAPTAVASVDEATRRAIVDQTRDSVFAELRRSGVLPTRPTRPAAPAASADGTPSAAPRADLRPLDRAIVRTGRTLDESAYTRLERAYVEDSPTDPDGWLKGFLEGFGVTGSPPPPAGSPAMTPAAPRNEHPVSNRGAPPAPVVPLEEQDLITMSPSDRDHLRKQKGDKWFTDKLYEQSRNRRVAFRK